MKLYVAATRQNDGKTIVSLGLLSVLRRRLKSIDYMKPVGQQYRVVKGKKIDKDVILMNQIFNFKGPLKDRSPIAIPKGFTENYILRGNPSTLENKIKRSFDKLAQKSQFVLIEGTGHAGVGSVFDMSNAEVAGLLGAKVVIVSCGGLGRPIDEIMLNHAKFDVRGIKVLGAIVNKVRKDKYDKLSPLIRKGLARKGVDVLGILPFEEVLSNPTISELLEDLDGKFLCGKKGLNNVVERFVIGDMVAHETLNYLAGGTLLITPGNREDVIFSALSGWVLGVTKKYYVAGIVATYGIKPPKAILDIMARSNIPLILVKEDSFSAARKINHMIFKLRAEDEVKVKKTEALIEKYVDVEKILKQLKK